MAMFEWSDDLSVGIISIDDQHKKLIKIINKLYNAMKERKTQEILKTVINELTLYARTHFSYEQSLFEQHSYPATNAHIAQHSAFVDKIEQFQRDYEDNKLLLSTDITNFLKDWLIKHIKGMDKKYSVFLQNKGVN